MTALRLAALLTALAIASAAQAQIGRVKRPDSPAADSYVPPAKQDKMFPVGSSWIAVSLNGKPFSGDRPSFTLDQQFRAKGFGGCNNYAATAFPLREQGLAVSAFALTKKSCDKAAMAVEHAFLVALRTAEKWDLSAGGAALVIKSPNGELRFERAL